MSLILYATLQESDVSFSLLDLRRYKLYRQSKCQFEYLFDYPGAQIPQVNSFFSLSCLS